MRKFGRVDTNQAEIVTALRKMGYSVESLAGQGDGCPDLLVGVNGANLLLEVKRPKGTRTHAQLAWHANWRGTVHVVTSTEDAMSVIHEILY